MFKKQLLMSLCLLLNLSSCFGFAQTKPSLPDINGIVVDEVKSENKRALKALYSTMEGTVVSLDSFDGKVINRAIKITFQPESAVNYKLYINHEQVESGYIMNENKNYCIELVAERFGVISKKLINIKISL